MLEGRGFALVVFRISLTIPLPRPGKSRDPSIKEIGTFSALPASKFINQ
jgi:hypothetical protein